MGYTGNILLNHVVVAGSVIAVTGFLLVACINLGSGSEDKITSSEVPAWQTICPVEGVDFDGWQALGDVELTPVGKPSSDMLSLYAFNSGDKVRLKEPRKPSRWKLKELDFQPAPQLDCGPFEACGYRFANRDGSVHACFGDYCLSAELHERPGFFSWAAAGGAVFAGTNWGDALIFKDGDWCCMTQEDFEFECRGGEPVPDEPTGR